MIPVKLCFVQPLSHALRRDSSPSRATTTTAASGGNREELLGQRPAGRECKTLHEADAGSRNPDAGELALERFLPEAKPLCQSLAALPPLLVGEAR